MRGRRGLPRPQGVGELPAAAGPARRDREPARVRPAVLQRRGRHAEHARSRRSRGCSSPASPGVSQAGVLRGPRGPAGAADRPVLRPRRRCNAGFTECRSAQRCTSRVRASISLAPVAAAGAPYVLRCPRSRRMTALPVRSGTAETSAGARGARRRRRGARRRGAARPDRDGRGGRRAPSTTACTCWCRPAPAPASRWATSSPRCSTTSASWSRPPRWPSSTSSSSGTSRRWSRPPSTSSTDAVVRRAQGALQLRLPAPHPRGRPRRPGRPRRRCPRARWAPRCSKLREWVEEEAGGGGTGDRDSAPRHTDRVWRQVSVSPPGVPRRGALPVRRRVLRRARQGARRSVAADRHQPLAARDRRDRGRADDPGVRRRGGRRGPRAGLPGDPGGDRRADRP